jgi:hypothetical protein
MTEALGRQEESPAPGDVVSQFVGELQGQG